MKVDAPEFTRIWRNSSSIAQVVAATGLTHSTARVRASRLRNAGVALQDLRSGVPIGQVAYPDRKVRRDANREAKLCINENKAGTHGPATHGCRCKACYDVHRSCS